MASREVLETYPPNVIYPDSADLMWRKLYHILEIPGLAPNNLSIDREEIGKAEGFLRAGGGLIIPITHFDYRTAIEMVLRTGLISSEFQKRPFLAPIAKHQYDKNPLIVAFSRKLGIKLMPVVTPDTIKRERKKIVQEALNTGRRIDVRTHPRLRELRNEMFTTLKEYSNAAVEYLTHGGIVGIAPQAERQPFLKEIGDGPLKLLFHRLRKNKPDFRKVGFLFMPMSVYGKFNYRKNHGLNLSKPFDTRLNVFMTLDELEELSEATSLTIDDTIISFMANQVDERYNRTIEDNSVNAALYYLVGRFFADSDSAADRIKNATDFLDGFNGYYTEKGTTGSLTFPF